MINYNLTAINVYSNDDTLRIRQVLESDSEPELMEQELNASYGLSLNQAFGLMEYVWA